MEDIVVEFVIAKLGGKGRNVIFLKRNVKLGIVMGMGIVLEASVFAGRDGLACFVTRVS